MLSCPDSSNCSSSTFINDFQPEPDDGITSEAIYTTRNPFTNNKWHQMSFKHYDRPPIGSLVQRPRVTNDSSSLRLHGTSNINAYGASVAQAGTYGDAYTKLTESYAKYNAPDGEARHAIASLQLYAGCGES